MSQTEQHDVLNAAQTGELSNGTEAAASTSADPVESASTSTSFSCDDDKHSKICKRLTALSEQHGHGDSASATAVDASTASNSCNDDNHKKMAKLLMDLYEESSYRDYLAGKDERFAKRYKEFPDRAEVMEMVQAIRKLHASIEEICQLAKESDPNFEMNYYINPYKSFDVTPETSEDEK